MHQLSLLLLLLAVSATPTPVGVGQGCVCVPYYLCTATAHGTLHVHGDNIHDARLGGRGAASDCPRSTDPLVPVFCCPPPLVDRTLTRPATPVRQLKQVVITEQQAMALFPHLRPVAPPDIFPVQKPSPTSMYETTDPQAGPRATRTVTDSPLTNCQLENAAISVGNQGEVGTTDEGNSQSITRPCVPTTFGFGNQGVVGTTDEGNSQSITRPCVPTTFGFGNQGVVGTTDEGNSQGFTESGVLTTFGFGNQGEVGTTDEGNSQGFTESGVLTTFGFGNQGEVGTTDEGISQGITESGVPTAFGFGDQGHVEIISIPEVVEGTNGQSQIGVTGGISQTVQTESGGIDNQSYVVALGDVQSYELVPEGTQSHAVVPEVTQSHVVAPEGTGIEQKLVGSQPHHQGSGGQQDEYEEYEWLPAHAHSPYGRHHY